MISITREEKQAVLERYPNVHIVRTMKQDSKRHHYFMTEEFGPMQIPISATTCSTTAALP